MAFDLTQVAASLLVAIVTASVTAFLTVWLALRRFYREKWWEAKMQAYTDIILALHHIKKHASSMLEAEMEAGKTEGDYWDGLRFKSREAWSDIKRFADIGEFLLSERSSRTLQEFIAHATSGAPDELFHEYLELVEAAADRCLPAFKLAALSDLRLPVRSSSSRRRQSAGGAISSG